jgi:dTDP-4-amino-4,6-dideoxygalactose transaminase
MSIPLLKVRMPVSAPEAVSAVLKSGYLADGAQVQNFEDLLRSFIGNPQVAALSDISGAITLALFMAGVRPGDEVITSPMVCTATTMPIANLFARPVWCDVDPLTGMLDPERIPELISEKTRAILIYHWGGDVADIDAINAVAHGHGVKTIEDASDGFGAEYKGKRLGNTGSDFTAYSFQAVKHLTCGEGGALFFKSAEDTERAKWLKRYGIHRPSFRLPNGDLNEKSDIPLAGYNFYLNNISATIGVEQFKCADALVSRYRENGRFYDECLRHIPGVTLVRRHAESVSAYWTYTLLAERRTDLIQALREAGIASQRLHVRNDIYSCFDSPRRDLPGVDYFDQYALSIPCGWWVTDSDREVIVETIRKGW